jgi:MATE family multidrug resistance protein
VTVAVQDLQSEFRPMVKLAWPVVLSEIGWMTMGIVDTVMVGRVGPEAIGGVSIGSVLYFAVVVFGLGVLLGLDTLVSQAFGAHKLEECHAWLLHGVYLSFGLLVPLTLVLLSFFLLFPVFGFHPAVLRETLPYFRALIWGLLPLLLFSTFRRYLQAMNQVKPILFAVASANVLNALVNWVLIFGKLGAPAMGTEGAGWATTLSRAYLMVVLFAVIARHENRERTGLWRTPLNLELARLRRLLALGLPAAMQPVLEVGVFAVATALAGRLAPVVLAAHQIGLQVASFTFMVPLGVASAGAVRVGQALGRRDPAAAERSGWMALALGAGFMGLAGLGLLSFPRAIMRIFTTDAAVIAVGTSLLLLAAVFQLFDGLQVVATGILRGTGDTRTPMACNLIGHWLIGLPVSYVFCFVMDWGIFGLWIGLSLGLIVVGAVLLWIWSRRVASMRKDWSSGET